MGGEARSPKAKQANMIHPIYPEVLVTTDQVADIIGNPSYKIIEVDMDPEAYTQGHIPGAIGWDWEKQLRDQETQEILTPEQFSQLLGESGVSENDNVVVYGDNNNWFACWAYWLLYMAGHQSVWVMDGGARKWFAEGRLVSQAQPPIQPSNYAVPQFDLSDKASTESVFESFFSPATHRLVDVRSSSEYSGHDLGPAGVEARCAIGGHIPTAINIPWNLNCNPDGTFKSPEELRELYASFDVNANNTVITYCAIGERASLSWFVLKRLLGHSMVMNYDRSMSQWSRIANAPIVGDRAA